MSLSLNWITPCRECRATPTVEGVELCAECEVLRLCRQTPPGGWVMRQAPENPLPGYEWPKRWRVVNLSPGGFKPFREIVAEGDTWAECLEQIRGEG